VEIKDIKKIVELVTENELTEFAMEDQGFKIEIKRGGAIVTQVVHASPVMTAPAAPAAAPAPVPAAAPVAANADAGLIEITSPMVGTFYASPSPDAEPYVSIGDAVGADTVVCIVEAMKVMNEIQAEVKGVIKKVLVQNAEAVQYGQPLFLVDPA
jgi:acetyl-CoA carboxylase biotin carboxyl carrier protein